MEAGTTRSRAHKAARKMRAAFAGQRAVSETGAKEPQLVLRSLPNSHRRGLLFSSDVPGKTRKTCAPHKLRNENRKNLRAALGQENRRFHGTQKRHTLCRAAVSSDPILRRPPDFTLPNLAFFRAIDFPRTKR